MQPGEFGLQVRLPQTTSLSSRLRNRGLRYFAKSCQAAKVNCAYQCKGVCLMRRIFSLFLAVGFAVAPVCAQSYSYNITKTSAWLEKRQLPDGAILYSANGINPYFANLAAIGWLQDSSKILPVEAWMRWY